MTIRFTVEKATKNTIKFSEVLENELEVPKISTLYVQKAALKELGYGEGKDLIVELKVQS